MIKKIEQHHLPEGTAKKEYKLKGSKPLVYCLLI